MPLLQLSVLKAPEKLSIVYIRGSLPKKAKFKIEISMAFNFNPKPGL